MSSIQSGFVITTHSWWTIWTVLSLSIISSSRMSSLSQNMRNWERSKYYQSRLNVFYPFWTESLLRRFNYSLLSLTGPNKLTFERRSSDRKVSVRTLSILCLKKDIRVSITSFTKSTKITEIINTEDTGGISRHMLMPYTVCHISSFWEFMSTFLVPALSWFVI